MLLMLPVVAAIWETYLESIVCTFVRNHNSPPHLEVANILVTVSQLPEGTTSLDEENQFPCIK